MHGTRVIKVFRPQGVHRLIAEVIHSFCAAASGGWRAAVCRAVPGSATMPTVNYRDYRTNEVDALKNEAIAFSGDWPDGRADGA